jgi:hypothetical protein
MCNIAMPLPMVVYQIYDYRQDITKIPQFKILRKVTVQVHELNMFEMYSASKLQIMGSSFENNQINFSLFPNEFKFEKTFLYFLMNLNLKKNVFTS